MSELSSSSLCISLALREPLVLSVFGAFPMDSSTLSFEKWETRPPVMSVSSASGFPRAMPVTGGGTGLSRMDFGGLFVKYSVSAPTGIGGE